MTRSDWHSSRGLGGSLRFEMRSLLLCLAIAASGVASAQEVVSASPDVTIALGAGPIVADENVVVDNQLGVAALESLGTILPGSTEVVAYGLDVNGDRLFAIDSAVLILGVGVINAGDVIRYDGSNYSIAFDARANGIPAGVGTNAVSLAQGGLLLSFDTTVDLGGGLVAADEDLVLWDGSSYSLLLDGSAAGIDPAADIDAAQQYGLDTFMLSVDVGGQVGGVAFQDEDVLRFDGGIWSLEVDSSTLDPAWEDADLTALMVPEPGVASSLMAGFCLLVRFARRTGGSLIGIT